jgi:hypothetical protein
MNTTTARTRFAAFSFATVLTLAMLLGVNTLATIDLPQQMAQASVPAQA